MEYSEKASFASRVLRDMTSSVLVLDRKGLIEYVNKPASEIFEISQDLEPGVTKFDLEINQEENDEFSTLVLDALFDREKTHTGKVKYVSPSGKEYYLRVSSSFLELESGMENLVVITISESSSAFGLMFKPQSAVNNTPFSPKPSFCVPTNIKHDEIVFVSFAPLII